MADRTPSPSNSERTKDYNYYKRYQHRNKIVLDIAETPEKLQEFLCH